MLTNAEQETPFILLRGGKMKTKEGLLCFGSKIDSRFGRVSAQCTTHTPHPTRLITGNHVQENLRQWARWLVVKDETVPRGWATRVLASRQYATWDSRNFHSESRTRESVMLRAGYPGSNRWLGLKQKPISSSSVKEREARKTRGLEHFIGIRAVREEVDQW